MIESSGKDERSADQVILDNIQKPKNIIWNIGLKQADRDNNMKTTYSN